MKKSWLIQLLLGLCLGMLLMVPGATSGPIQSQVGINVRSIGNDQWMGWCEGLSNQAADAQALSQPSPASFCTWPEVQTLQWVFNGTNYDRLRAAIGNTDATTAANMSATGQLVWNETNTAWERPRAASADSIGSATGIGIPAAGLMIFNTTTSQWDRMRSSSLAGAPTVATAVFDGTNWSSLRQASASTLTATTSTGIVLEVPASTWSVTNTPATATQATASRAAGGGTVRHVATTVTVCLATGATAQTPILAHLRDGATGAGTILRSWAHSAPANSTFCNNVNGLAMIGTANTAMTIEFTGAGVAASQQTVTVTGFSVP